VWEVIMVNNRGRTERIERVISKSTNFVTACKGAPCAYGGGGGVGDALKHRKTTDPPSDFQI